MATRHSLTATPPLNVNLAVHECDKKKQGNCAFISALSVTMLRHECDRKINNALVSFTTPLSVILAVHECDRKTNNAFVSFTTPLTREWSDPTSRNLP
jgi:hypothetical protein